MDVKRYECQCYEGGMSATANGAYVTFADYDRLRKLYEDAHARLCTLARIKHAADNATATAIHNEYVAHDTLRKEAGL